MSKMRQNELLLLIPQVCQLAKKAGEAIMEVYNHANREGAFVGNKTDDSPLTLADLASHHVICDGLHELTPALPVVSEESEASLSSRVPKGIFWLIDPLDGTKEFLARNGEFTVNIALIVDGEPVWGVVYAPALDLMYWGGRSLGASREAAGVVMPIRVAGFPGVDGCFRVVASKSHLNTETSAFIAKFARSELIQAGSSLKFCRLAEGGADVYPRLAPTCEWDTAAAQAVLEGAGGYVFDVAGVRLAYGKPDVLNPSFIAATVCLSELGGK